MNTELITNMNYIQTIINTVNSVEYFKNVNINHIELIDDFFHIEIEIYTIYCDTKYIINCGFGASGFYIDHYEVQFNTLIELLKNSCSK